MMMRFSVKHGLSLLAGIFLSATAMASEPVPIEDRDAFEKQYIACIMSGAKNNCYASLVSKHLDPSLKKTDTLILSLEKVNWICQGKTEKLSSVYEVHAIDKIIRGGVVDSRTYLIECSNGDFIGAYMNFRKVNGKWYIFAYSINSSNEFIQKLLKLPTDY
jgi:hypothetical protein